MPGRNDPCPCGSGKKYKQCCLKKDEEARRAARAEAERAAREADAPPPLFSPRFPYATGTGDALWDPPGIEPGAGVDLTPFEARWEEFEAAEDYEEKIATFQATLDEGLMDDENAFEMLNTLYDLAVDHDERDRFDGLVALLRERVPDVYAQNAHFCLDWLISNALATGRVDALPALTEEFADLAGEHLDTVTRVFDQLAYHGQLPLLAAVMRRAWPRVHAAPDIFEPAAVDFAVRAMTFALLDYLERTPEPDVARMEELSAYFEGIPERSGAAAQFLAHVSGQSEQRWTLDDFDLSTPDGQVNLYDLTVDFLGYLRREEGVSYAKGELAREQIQQYLVDRHSDAVKAIEDGRKARKSGTRLRAPEPGNLLCPDSATLDRYLGGLLYLLNWEPHRAAALFEMLPAWLRFLEARTLINAGRRERTLRELSALVPNLARIWDSYAADPALRKAIGRWRKNAGLA